MAGRDAGLLDGAPGRRLEAAHRRERRHHFRVFPARTTLYAWRERFAHRAADRPGARAGEGEDQGGLRDVKGEIGADQSKSLRFCRRLLLWDGMGGNIGGLNVFVLALMIRYPILVIWQWIESELPATWKNTFEAPNYGLF